MFVAGYALSPIDLIPDFIPVIGLLDDAIIVPLGILIVIKLIPSEIVEEHRATVAAGSERPVSRIAAAAIGIVWLGLIIVAAWMTYRYVVG